VDCLTAIGAISSPQMSLQRLSKHHRQQSSPVRLA
jgi:hypothetical protein